MLGGAPALGDGCTKLLEDVRQQDGVSLGKRGRRSLSAA